MFSDVMFLYTTYIFFICYVLHSVYFIIYHLSYILNLMIIYNYLSSSHVLYFISFTSCPLLHVLYLMSFTSCPLLHVLYLLNLTLNPRPLGCSRVRRSISVCPGTRPPVLFRIRTMFPRSTKDCKTTNDVRICSVLRKLLQQH